MHARVYLFAVHPVSWVYVAMPTRKSIMAKDDVGVNARFFNRVSRVLELIGRSVQRHRNEA